MIKMTTIAGLLLISSTVFASSDDCKRQVVELAQMNMDARAKAHGFQASHIDETTVAQLPGADESGIKVYRVLGAIYRADFTVTIAVNTSCGIESLVIKDAGGNSNSSTN